ncbi:c-type cytochrome [Weeksellaceae bacterium A-14]|uniref:c-type cytochrome n=1 Tax=Daejeonia sp. YH14 TaxID=3439042 RepID=UPI0031E4C9EE
MKKLLPAVLLLLLFSCSKKEESSSIPDMGNMMDSSKKTESKPAVTGDQSLAGYQMIGSSDCMSCHKDNAKFIGPSYKEIADKYTLQDEAYLADKIIEGGSGVWGQVPMQAHPGISKEEAKKMVEYILSMKK